MNEITFIVEDAEEGGYIAKAINASIYTEADNLTELHQQVRESVQCHFEEEKNKNIVLKHI